MFEYKDGEFVVTPWEEEMQIESLFGQSITLHATKDILAKAKVKLIKSCPANISRETITHLGGYKMANIN